MKDLSELKSKLLMELKKSNAFDNVIDLIVQYYTNKLSVTDKEVAILLADSEKTVLSFAAPKYLIDAGLIPISSAEAIASTIFRTGNPVIDNWVHLKKHLSIFELIKTPKEEILPIWKIIGVRLAVENQGIGVIEISKRAEDQIDAGDDFIARDLQFLETTAKEIAPILYQVIPEDFKSKLS